MERAYRAWAEVDLDAIRHNVTEIKKCLRPGVKLMGVVKADAYGHGVYEVARTLLENGADTLAVAFCDEAVELRKMGIDAPILVLGISHEDDIGSLVEFDITPAVSDFEFAEKLSFCAEKMKKTAKLHIKLDTGMSRIGFLTDSDDAVEETVKKVLQISKLPMLEVEGMFSHFATADEENSEYTLMQYDRFLSVAEGLKKQGLEIPVKHVCNSAGLVKFPQMQLDMVRAGIILYGLYPSKEFDRKLIELVPAMSFKTRISHIKELEKDSCISYGRTHTLHEKATVATLSVGYADGYSRNLSNRVQVLVNGQPVQQIGRICMDQCMIDASQVNNINVGDEVTLFGSDSAEVSADSVADILGTINYEVVCDIGRRVPRVYIENGKILKTLNYILHECGL